MSSSDKFLWINLSEELIIVLIIISRLRIISSSTETTVQHNTVENTEHSYFLTIVSASGCIVCIRQNLFCSLLLSNIKNTINVECFLLSSQSRLRSHPCEFCPVYVLGVLPGWWWWWVMAAAKTPSLRCYLLPGRLLTSSLGPRRDSINELFSS